MTEKEYLNWNLWRKEKSRHVIEYLALALTCRQTPKSRKFIAYAIHDAAKLFALELQHEYGIKRPGLVAEIEKAVSKSPADAESLLAEIVATVKSSRAGIENE